MKSGDTITMPCTFRRKWWQFWKPRTWTVTRAFTLVRVEAGATVPRERAVDRAHVEAGIMPLSEYVERWR